MVGTTGGAPGLGGRRPGILLIAPENDRAPLSSTLPEVRTDPRSPCHPAGEGEARTLSDSLGALSPQTGRWCHTPHKARKGAACVAGKEGPVASVGGFMDGFWRRRCTGGSWGSGGTLAKVTLRLPGDSSILSAVAERGLPFSFSRSRLKSQSPHLPAE